MLAKQIKSLAIVVGLSLTLLSSGCIFGPGNGANVGSRSESVFFEGATNHAGQTITIWAKKSDGTWQYLGKTVTVSQAIGHFGHNWYYWSTSKKVPLNCWKLVGGNYVAEIKATGWDPLIDLPAFNEGFLDYLDEYDDLGELVEAEGSGTTMKIYANP
jgi:hypothetical protein